MRRDGQKRSTSDAGSGQRRAVLPNVRTVPDEVTRSS
jgi:hypothetical protein